MLGNKYVAAIIGILLIIVIAYNVKFFTSKNRPSEPSKIEKTAQPSVASKHAAPYINKKLEHIIEQEDSSKWKRDPFDLQVIPAEKPVAKRPEFSEDIHLMGILKRDGKSHVLLNGKVYSVGDRIGDAVIKEINKHGIVLSSGDQSKEISFEDYKILKEKAK